MFSLEVHTKEGLDGHLQYFAILSFLHIGSRALWLKNNSKLWVHMELCALGKYATADILSATSILCKPISSTISSPFYQSNYSFACNKLFMTDCKLASINVLEATILDVDPIKVSVFCQIFG